MEIRGPGGIGASRDINPAEKKPARAPAREGQGRSSGGDKVEISDLARLKGLMANVPPIRAEKVAAIKEQIKSGKYLTDEKLNQAFDNMLKEELGA